MTVPVMWIAGLVAGCLVVRWLWNYFVPPTGTVPKRYQVVPREG